MHEAILCFFGILPDFKNVKRNRVVNSVTNVRLCTGRLMISSAKKKKRKKMVTKVQSQNWKVDGNWDAYFRTLSRRNLSSCILGKSAKVLRPIPSVRFAKAALWQRKGPALGIICPADPCERSPFCAKIRGQFSGWDWKTGAMRPRRRVETCQERSKARRNGQRYLLLTYQRMVSPSAIRD